MRDLRVSVTDRCNFRCTYCMPFDEYPWIPHGEVLTFDEIARIVRLSVGLGVTQVRLTGGEPLVRPGLADLVSKLAGLSGIEDLSLTTNGSLLAGQIGGLHAAGLRRINLSMDTLDPDKFRRMTKRGDLTKVLDGLFAAKAAGLSPIKINAVVERGVNDDDILPMVEFARENGFALRFIEYMDVGNANAWRSDKMVSKKEILEVIGARYPMEELGRAGGSAPSVDFRFVDGKGEIGVIASVTEPFCASCTRARLTADGKLVTCLFSDHGHDLKHLLRSGAGDEEICDSLAAVWRGRTDRYSAERLQLLSSAAGYHPERRKLEMITLGG
jgi:cyclic pyranopterin phosphate synthase